MATLFDKIKKALGFYPKASYYKIEPATGEPIKVTYQEESVKPSDNTSFIPQPQAEEPAVDSKCDDIDLAAMTKVELRAFAAERSIPVNTRMSKQQLIDAINEAL